MGLDVCETTLIELFAAVSETEEDGLLNDPKAREKNIQIGSGVTRSRYMLSS